MAKYLLIASRDPFESTEVDRFYDLAGNLKEEGNDVTLFLVQNGVFPSRPGSRSQHLADLAKTGVQVLADDFSLRERGIDEDRLVAGVKPAPISVVIDELAEGTKALWG